MAAVGVTKTAGGVVVFGEEKRGEGGVSGVVAEELIHRAQEAIGLIERDAALAAEIGLKIGHEQGGGDAFAGNVADDEAEAFSSELQKVVVITADVAGREAVTRKFQSGDRWQRLREETRLDLFGDFEFLGGAAFGFEFFGEGPALRFNFVSDFIKADERERVAVRILEASERAAPDGGMLRLGR